MNRAIYRITSTVQTWPRPTLLGNSKKRRLTVLPPAFEGQRGRRSCRNDASATLPHLLPESRCCDEELHRCDLAL
jgi:hypothetical protein